MSVRHNTYHILNKYRNNHRNLSSHLQSNNLYSVQTNINLLGTIPNYPNCNRQQIDFHPNSYSELESLLNSLHKNHVPQSNNLQNN